MEKDRTMSAINTDNRQINTRQLAFFAAFVLPVGKLLELPSLLTAYNGGDLLIAAVLGLFLEFISFAALILFSKRSQSTPIEALTQRCGKPTARIFCGIYALFLLMFATLPLFDLEKFSHSAFSDTSPTFFVFTPFLILSGFICTKGIKAVGRTADLSPALFLIPLLGLLAMSVGQADFSRLLPIVEKPLTNSIKAVWKTLPYFSSGGLLLPLFSGYRYRSGDAKKLLPAFGGGAALTLLFLATFFAVFGLFGEKEHFAVLKIAQFFPALKFVGRIDLILVYLLAIGLFYYTALPLQLFTDCFTRCFALKSKLPTAIVLTVALYPCMLFFNKYSNAIHAFFSQFLPPVFLVFSLLLPILFLLLFGKKGGGRYQMNNKNTEQGTDKENNNAG